ncbi:PKD domain-containing protein [Pontibacter vulgaris]|uniref:PKD domain-containing protein n=1 Tax=Pontibacter vulgaris TaxID=2905679 RepID=UPI001FA7834E|nr:gliding motility-associated C-terminal domain-containing protein [Pontibacter vulgaris]
MKHFLQNIYTRCLFLLLTSLFILGGAKAGAKGSLTDKSLKSSVEDKISSTGNASNIAVGGISPIAEFQFVPNCGTDSTVFTDASMATGSVTSGNVNKLVSWYWEFGDGSTSGKQNPKHLYASPGTYTVKLKVKSALGLSDKITKQVKIGIEPVPDFQVAGGCSRSVITFADKSTVAEGTITGCEWDFGDGTPHVKEMGPSHTYAKGGTYVITLKVSTSDGCTRSVSRSVLVNHTPKPLFSLPNICSEDVAFIKNQTGIENESVKYKWYFGDGATSTDSNPKHKYATYGNYKVKLAVVTAKGCADSLEVNYTVNSSDPKANFEAVYFCQKDGVEFSDRSSLTFGRIIKWVWDFGDGTTSNQQHPTHKYAKPGNYKVRLKAYSGISCYDITEQTITIIPSPDAGFATADVCFGEKTIFTNNSTFSSGKIVKQVWDFGDGNGSLAHSPAHTYAQAGTYNVKLTVTAENGCQDSFSKNVNVFAVPKVAFSPVGVCITGPATFKNETVLANGSIKSWHWTFGDGSSSDEQNPQHTYSKKGKYKVRLVAITANGCTNTLEQIVNVVTPPVAKAGPDQVPLCGPVTTKLAANTPEMPATGTWTIASGAGGSFSDATDPKAIFYGQEGQLYTLRWTVKSSPCLEAVDEVKVKFSAIPGVSIGPNTEIEVLEGGSVTIPGSGDGRLLWSPATGLDNPASATPTASPTETTVYTLTATTEDGCTNSKTVTVKVLDHLKVTTGISPNGDGINDSWVLEGIEFYPDISVSIYNRWGEIVYASKGYRTPWDATHNGTPVPDGAYYYIIDTHRGRKPFKGSITVLR